MEKRKPSPSELHKEHRMRMRKRFINDEGLEYFETHQILEMILFYGVHLKDTNEAAHMMLNEFGSLHALLDASPAEIVKRCQHIKCGNQSITENVAVLLSMYPHVFRSYMKSKMASGKQEIRGPLDVAEYIRPFLTGRLTECFYLICLNLHQEIKRIIKISEGTEDKTPIFIRSIVKTAINNNAVHAVIAHNHPGGVLKPSMADIKATERVQKALEVIEINLLDHVILTDFADGKINDKKTYYSFAEKNLLNLQY